MFVVLSHYNFGLFITVAKPDIHLIFCKSLLPNLPVSSLAFHLSILHSKLNKNSSVTPMSHRIKIRYRIKDLRAQPFLPLFFILHFKLWPYLTTQYFCNSQYCLSEFISHMPSALSHERLLIPSFCRPPSSPFACKTLTRFSVASSENPSGLPCTL